MNGPVKGPATRPSAHHVTLQFYGRLGWPLGRRMAAGEGNISPIRGEGRVPGPGGECWKAGCALANPTGRVATRDIAERRVAYG